MLSSVASFFGSIGIGGGGVKAPNVYDGKSSMGLSQHDLLRTEAKDTCTLLAILLPGYKHKYICTTMVQMGPPFEITAKPCERCPSSLS